MEARRLRELWDAIQPPETLEDIEEHGRYYLLHGCSFYGTGKPSLQDTPRTRAMTALLRVAAVAARGVYLLEKGQEELVEGSFEKYLGEVAQEMEDAEEMQAEMKLSSRDAKRALPSASQQGPNRIEGLPSGLVPALDPVQPPPALTSSALVPSAFSARPAPPVFVSKQPSSLSLRSAEVPLPSRPVAEYSATTAQSSMVPASMIATPATSSVVTTASNTTVSRAAVSDVARVSAGSSSANTRRPQTSPHAGTSSALSPRAGPSSEGASHARAAMSRAGTSKVSPAVARPSRKKTFRSHNQTPLPVFRTPGFGKVPAGTKRARTEDSWAIRIAPEDAEDI
ncbi:hypothetical protein K466DRAFT_607020 [Polyporus arcularius HHB13444]|uniref:Uncharacterized protein n=1 Tax=Polyporus arcularius HHB13444 TaxID=1314778 RepID=A0A5C3NL12_9APHY|nr:hypothetical protein K466DRAFT_607020 [Polyporus arcularius HHB13444]